MAKKSLSERIAERAQSSKATTKSAQNRAAFLAVKADVVEALEAKWPMKTIWETLRDEDQIAVCYDTFRHYVHLHINQSPSPLSPPKGDDQEPEQSGTASKKKREGFIYSSTPDKKDLI